MIDMTVATARAPYIFISVSSLSFDGDELIDTNNS